MRAPCTPLLPIVAALALLWTALQPNLARALSVHWTAPAPCADAREVRERIAETLGPRADDPSLAVQARVTTRGGEWLLEVRLTAPEVTDVRTLRAASCEPMPESVAVIVAALLPAKPREPEAERRDTRLGLAASLWSVGELGALPGPTAGFAPGIELLANAFRFGLAGWGFVPREGRVAEAKDAVTRVGLWALGLSACFDWPVKRVTVSPCIRAEAGQVRARETGLPGGGASAATWLAPGGSLALRFKLSERWTLGPEVLGMVALRRARIDVGPPGREVLVHEQGPVSLRIGIVLSALLWNEK